MMETSLLHRLFKPVSIAPLVNFRILFGCLMLAATLRFILNGWVEQLYIRPAYHFPFFGWSWVQVYSPAFIYTLFALLLVFAAGIALGLAYRVSAVGFFLVFSYIELIDKTYYLNHYYFIMLMSFLLIFLPAHKRFSLDWYFFRRGETTIAIPYIYLFLVQVQLLLVYFFAGAAKINSDWLLHAQPLRTWLPPHSHLPLAGGLLAHPYTAYIMSWAGCLFDLSVGFALFFRATRVPAYICIILFHLVTGYLFPIGMFPYVMIVLTTVFFSAGMHERLLVWMEKKAGTMPAYFPKEEKPPGILLRSLLGVFICTQLLFPLRYLLYPGHVFWTEQGFRFSWRVMLMEKNGVAFFRVYDPARRTSLQVQNADWLTPLQEKMMATQPDMLVDYAQLLCKKYTKQLGTPVQVYAEVYVTLNGRPSALLIDPDINLAAETNSCRAKKFITPSPAGLW